MKLLLIFISLLVSNSLYAQVQLIEDEKSDERDIEFVRYPCNSDTIKLRRILIKSGNQPSVRNGRELLIGYKNDLEYLYKFEEISAYSSLYIDSSSFNVTDVNKDGNKELLIKLSPHESTESLYIYTMGDSCEFEFIKRLTLSEYSVVGNEIKVFKSIICESWACTKYALYLESDDYDKLERSDFYKIKDDSLVNNTAQHPEQIRKHKKDYREVIEKVDTLNTEAKEFRSEKVVDGLIKEIKNTLNDY